MKLYKIIDDPAEIKEYQQWARDNYKPHTPINGTWHPLVQAECVRINELATVEMSLLNDQTEVLRHD